jgi:hypothetical protein
MNTNFYYFNPNVGYCNNDQEKTTFKGNGQFTPLKKGKISDENLSLDSTMIMSQPTLVKHISHVSHMQTTPEKSKKTEIKAYDATIRTPIKKSKRRDCTPAYSDDEDEKIGLDQNNYFCNAENIYSKNLPACNLFGPQSMNCNSIPNYNILKLTGREGMNSFSMLSNKAPQFEKLSKSKFLDKINTLSSSNNSDQENSLIESSEIFDKIKGTYLFNVMDYDCTSNDFGNFW